MSLVSGFFSQKEEGAEKDLHGAEPEGLLFSFLGLCPAHTGQTQVDLRSCHAFPSNLTLMVLPDRVH
jgi:hypothetical protein